MNYRVGIVGATGVVGQELIRLLLERKFPCEGLRAMASSRSAGQTIEVGERTFTIKEAAPEQFADLDVAIFSAGAGVSKQLAPEAAKRGCLVIDNSSAFRLDENTPLVVPEINAEAIRKHQGIIANPNCSTAITLMGLYPLHAAFGLKRFVAATYQAVSGSGIAGMKELENQATSWANGEEYTVSEYPYPIAFNLIPQVGDFQEDGYAKEEHKMVDESRKILEQPALKISTTCVRLPVFRAHSIAIHAEFEKPVSLETAHENLKASDGVELLDANDANAELPYPMPLYYEERIPCGVGRLRVDTALDNGLALWVVGDQLWKGAALNAIQIAEWMHQNNLLKKQT